MRRAAGLLVAVLLLCAGCRGEATPDVDQRVGDVESTLDAIEADLGGDG